MYVVTWARSCESFLSTIVIPDQSFQQLKGKDTSTRGQHGEVCIVSKISFFEE